MVDAKSDGEVRATDAESRHESGEAILGMWDREEVGDTTRAPMTIEGEKQGDAG